MKDALKASLYAAIDDRSLKGLLGYDERPLNPVDKAQVQRALDAVFEVARPRWRARRFFGAAGVDGIRLEGAGEVRSRDLARTFAGIDEVVLVVCTLGHEVGRLIQRAALLAPSEALFLDAAASAGVEALAQIQHGALADEAPSHRRVTERFSPGFGDLSLSEQARLIALVDPSGSLGVRTNAAHLMIPEKSITFLAGVGDRSRIHPHPKCDHRCSRCTLDTCAYRRNPR